MAVNANAGTVGTGRSGMFQDQQSPTDMVSDLYRG